MRPYVITLFVASLFGAACDNALDCTQIEAFPVEIVLVDFATGGPVADSAAATATKNGVTWPLGPYRTDGAGRVLSPWGGSGPGTYALGADHPRYQRWDTNGVVVEAAEGCRPFVPVQITARLLVR